MPFWIYALFFLLIVMYFVSTIRIAPEHQRFAIYVLGQFKELKGRGMFFKLSGRTNEWVRIELGDRGELVSNDKLKIKNKVVPAVATDQISLGAEYMISGFNEHSVQVSTPRT